MLDLAVLHGQVDTDLDETVRLSRDRATALIATLPHLVFHSPVPTKETP